MDAARKKLGETVPRPLSAVEAVAIVSRWFLQRNKELDQDHLHRPFPPEGWSDAVAGNEYNLADTARRLGMNDIQAFAPLAERILEAEGVKADPAGPAIVRSSSCWYVQTRSWGALTSHGAKAISVIGPLIRCFSRRCLHRRHQSGP